MPDKIEFDVITKRRYAKDEEVFSAVVPVDADTDSVAVTVDRSTLPDRKRIQGKVEKGRILLFVYAEMSWDNGISWIHIGGCSVSHGREQNGFGVVPPFTQVTANGVHPEINGVTRLCRVRFKSIEKNVDAPQVDIDFYKKPIVVIGQ